MEVEPRNKRVPIMLSQTELEAIDDWRFANRVATRSEAIRRLCIKALAKDLKKTQEAQMKRMAFGDEG